MRWPCLDDRALEFLGMTPGVIVLGPEWIPARTSWEQEFLALNARFVERNSISVDWLVVKSVEPEGLLSKKSELIMQGSMKCLVSICL